MKKLPFILLLTLMGIVILNSCKDDEPSFRPNVNDILAKNTKSNGRSIAEAAEIARQSISLIKDGQSRASGRHFDMKNVKVGVTTNSRGASDTLMYVFNFDDNQGFSIVAYNRNVEGLIAVTEQGYYDPSVPTDNPGFELYMGMAREMLANAGGGGNSTYKLPDSLFIGDDSTHNALPIDTNENRELVQYKFEKKVLDSVIIEPNYNLKWGQTNPEGLLCPNGKSGCTNTAMAIIMSYFNYPTSIALTYDGHKEDMIALDWNLIKQHHQSVNGLVPDDCIYNEIGNHDMLAKLCRQLAELNKSTFNYHPDNTSTVVGMASLTFKSLGFSCSDYIAYDMNQVFNTLKRGGKVITSGLRDFAVDEHTRHAWVIDGMIYEKFWTGEYIKRWGEDWELVNDHGISSSFFQHINWGWEGDGNGYYTSTVFNKFRAYWYDTDCEIIRTKSDTTDYYNYYNIKTAHVNKLN